MPEEEKVMVVGEREREKEEGRGKAVIVIVCLLVDKKEVNAVHSELLAGPCLSHASHCQTVNMISL